MGRDLVIGVDLGATTVKAAIVSPRGKILKHQKVDTFARKGPAAVIRQIRQAVDMLLGTVKKGDVLGIGIGAPGIVGLDGSVVRYPPNFSDWVEVDLGREIRKRFRVPVRVENDANLAALAEARYGAGKERKDFLFVIWGTGVGGGIIVDGDIFRGPQGGAGEIGHVTIDVNGPQCGCGNRGCVEAYVGQRYLSQRTRERLDALGNDRAGGPPSRIIDLVGGNLEQIEPALISAAAKQGDTIAREILEEAGTLLGVGLASVVNVLDLTLVVIGGGISAAEPFVFAAIERSIRLRVLKGHRDDIRVVPAKLGNTAGVLGAASLIRQKRPARGARR